MRITQEPADSRSSLSRTLCSSLPKLKWSAGEEKFVFRGHLRYHHSLSILPHYYSTLFQLMQALSDRQPYFALVGLTLLSPELGSCPPQRIHFTIGRKSKDALEAFA